MPCGAQTAPGYLWTVASGTPDTPLAVTVDNQGQIRTVGHSSADLYFHTYDTNGQILQSATCTNWATFQGAAIDSAGNVYATGGFGKTGQFGSIKLTDSGNGAMFVAKYSPAGVPLWGIGSTGGAGVYGWAVAVDPAGNAYVSGEFSGSSATPALQVRIGTIALNNYILGESDAFLAKIDPKGKILWAKRFGDGVVRRSTAIALDKSGNAYIGAGSVAGSGAVQAVYKFDTSGNQVWVRSSKPVNGLLGGSASATAIATDDQGNISVAGAICGTNLFGTTTLWTKAGPYDLDIEVTKYDSAGNVLWACKDGGTNIDGAIGIIMDKAGNAFALGLVDEATTIAGTSITISTGYYIAKCNTGGGFAWALPTPRFPGQGTYPNGIMATAPDGSVYFAGNSGSSSSLSRLGMVDCPVITGQPTNQTIKPNATATLTVQATPARTLSYQWYRGLSGDISSPVAGAISNVFTTPPLTQTTPFWVRVSNPAGSVDSATATISLPVAPTITVQPQNNMVVQGQSVTLSVTATGSEPLTYQWYQILNWSTYSPIDGAVSNTYTTPPLTSNSSFVVRVSNDAGTVDSGSVTIMVVPPLQITKQPQSMTITNGQIVTLSVTATGGQVISYQWYLGNSGDTNNPIPYETLSTYTTPPLTQTTRYWVLVRAVGAGSQASDTAVLSLNNSPASLGGLGISGGTLSLRLTGSPGSKWSLLSSSNLVNWAPVPSLANITLDMSGATNVQVQVGSTGRAFYRATVAN